MTLSEHDIELIDKYLIGKINKEERQLLESKIDESSVFSEEVKLRQEMIASIKKQDRKHLRKELNELYQESKNEKPTVRYFYWAAASVAIIIVSFLFLFYPSNKSELFQAYYQPFPEPPALRGSAGDKSEAMLAYSKGQYQKALTIFSSSPESSDSLSLYIGNCLLNLNQEEKAKEHFTEILKGKNESLKEHAQWYLVLSYIKNDNIDRASQLLEKIIIEQGAYYKLATELKSDLE